jgi:hypothetical protein
MAPALSWCIIEVNTSIIAGCVPTLKPFFEKYLHKRLRIIIRPTKLIPKQQGSPNMIDEFRAFDINAGLPGTGVTKTTVYSTQKNSENSSGYINTQAQNGEEDSEKGLGSTIPVSPVSPVSPISITKTVEFGFEEHDGTIVEET